jgi:hypothetical protein
VVFHDVDGVKHEPIELVTADVEETHQGGVMQALGERKGELVNMEPDGRGRVRLEYRIPARGLIGFANEFMNLTRGSGLISNIFNGYEQNSQWLDPQNPLRQVDHTADQSVIQVSSLEGYGAPIMDIGHLCMGSRFAQVVGTMKNFIPERMVRATGTMMRMNIDDGDIFIGEFANGAIGSIQTSFVTVGNYPGIEARVYGSKGALICRMVEENGVAETLKAASADSVEFKELEIPQRFYPTGGSPRESWRSLFYANLTHSFISEIRGDVAGNEGNFEDGAHVQELINAVERSYRERRWVSIPMERDATA